MAVPIALLEAGGDKILPLVWDDGGTNKSAQWKAIGKHVLNTTDTAHVGVGTHEDAATWAAGDPIVVIGGVEGTTARGLVADSTGRLNVIPGALALGGNAHADVAVGGTAIQFVSNTCRRVTVSADADNGSAAYLGDSTVTNDTTAATGGLQLDAGQSITLDLTNTNVLWVNGAAGVGVGFIWMT